MMSLYSKLFILYNIVSSLQNGLDDLYQTYSHKENDAREAGNDEAAISYAWAMWATHGIADALDEAVKTYITSGNGLDD